MCNLLTPILSLATAGMMDGLGLDIDPALGDAVQGFATGGIKGAVTGVIAGGIGDLAYEALQEAPGFLTDLASELDLDFIPDLQDFTQEQLEDISMAIQNQAQSWLQNSVKGYTEGLTSVRTFATSAFDLGGNIDRMKYLTGDEFGFGLGNPVAQITAGISENFNIGSEDFGVLTNELKNNFGSCFDFSDLTKTFTPTGVVDNLIKQGFSDEVLSVLDQSGISYDDIQSGKISDAVVSQAMNKMSPRLLNDIISELGVKVANGQTINKFSELLDASKILSPQALQVAPDYGVLTNNMFNVAGFNGSLATAYDWGDFLGQVPNTSYPLLTAAGNNPAALASLYDFNSQILGFSGSSVFNTPTIADMAGTAFDSTYSTNINLMTTLQAQVMNTAQGQNLRSAILTASGTNSDPVADAAAAAAIRAALVPFTNPTNPVLAQTITRGNTAYRTNFERFVTEVTNLRIADISLQQIKGSPSGLVAFSSGLHDIASDNYNEWLGWENAIVSSTDSSVYGEAIKAGIDEGYTFALLKKYGIPVPDTKVDSAQWAKTKTETGI